MQVPYQEYNQHYNQHFNYIPYEHFHSYQPVQYIHYPPPYEQPVYHQPVYQQPQRKIHDDMRRHVYKQTHKSYEEDHPRNMWRHYPQRYLEDFALMEKEAKRKELEFRNKERELKIQEETLIQQQEKLLKEKEEFDALQLELQLQQEAAAKEQQEQQEAAAKQRQDAATQTADITDTTQTTKTTKTTQNQIKPTLRFNNLPKYFKDDDIQALLTDYNIEGIYSSFDKDGNKKNSTCVCFMNEEDCLKAKDACEIYLPAIHKGIQIAYIKNKPKEYTRWDNFTATLIS
jgi:hypothetical protein